MRPGVLALLSCIGSASCGGVETVPPAVQASNAPCATSFTCPDGERCDHGRCALDLDCPAAAPVAPLHEETLEQIQSSFAYFVVAAGREYIFDSNFDTPDEQFGATTARFLDLRTGEASYWSHAKGYGTCWGSEMVWCKVWRESEGHRLFEGVALDATAAMWTGGIEHAIPEGYGLVATDEIGTPESRLFLWNAEELRSFDLETGTSELLVEITFQTFNGLVPPTATRPWSALFRDWTSTDLGPLVTFWTIPLAAGATPAEVVALQLEWGSGNYIVPLPAGENWFVVHDTPAPDTLSVWSVVEAVLTLVGTSADPALLDVVGRYRWGDPALIDGKRGYSLVCGGETCRSALVDLATLSIDPVGEVTIAGSDLSVLARKELACGAIDAILADRYDEIPDEPFAPRGLYRYYSVRVLAE